MSWPVATVTGSRSVYDQRELPGVELESFDGLLHSCFLPRRAERLLNHAYLSNNAAGNTRGEATESILTDYICRYAVFLAVRSRLLCTFISINLQHQSKRSLHPLIELSRDFPDDRLKTKSHDYFP